jgi:superfamily II DNA or RNA helicase
MTSLGFRGYSVFKEEIGENEVENIKKELTVTPYVPEGFGAPPPTFKLYLESQSKLYLPKSYGLKKFGAPKIDKLVDIENIDVPFTGKLRQEQHEPVNNFLAACNDSTKRGGIITVPCGYGKCLGYDTDIIMYDGSIKKVQDVVVGDRLMGDDSSARTVLSLARGREMMYDVVSQNGESYRVNESHILSLKCSTNLSKDMKKGDIVDISVNEVLNLQKSFHGKGDPLLGYKVGIDFPEASIPLDPYILGLCLGDGASSPTKHKFYDILKEYNLIDNKHIPQVYKCNSRENRLKLLAGLIDNHGYYRKNCYKIVQKNKKLSNDILFLVRSLGFAGYQKVVHKTCTYYMVSFHGNGLEFIPVLCPWKKACESKQIKDALVSRISLKQVGIDEYYGFEIDGNKRFLLGDFTVTHNTTMAIYLMCSLKVKTLIVVHKEFLLQQWKERLEFFAPTARIGLIKASKLDVEDKDVVIGSLQSLAMKEYNDDVFKGFGLTIIDEVHHTSAEVFSRALKKISFRYTLGLSATPKRKDGLTKVFMWYLGDTVYNLTKRTDTLLVKIKEFYSSNPDYSKEWVMYNKKPNMPKMINNICEYEPRLKFVIDTIKEILDVDVNRKILILSDRRNHVDTLINRLDVMGYSAGVYYGGMNPKELKISEGKQIIGGTYGYSSEGLDIKGLNTLILASPKSDVVQVVGRILRDKPEDREYIPLVIDIVDNFSMFVGQGKKRLAYYKKCKYDIEDESNVFETEKKKNKVEIPKNVCLL